MKKIFKISIILGVLFFCFPVLAVGNLSDAFKVDNMHVYANNDPLDSAARNMGYNIGRLGQGGSSPEGIVSMIITAVLSLLGVVFIILIIYGGILWMTAGGNEESVKKAKNIITQSVIGLVIVLLAYTISYFVIKIFISTTPTN